MTYSRAGTYETGTAGQGEGAQGASDQAKEKASQAADQAKEKAGQAADQAKSAHARRSTLARPRPASR